jgi:hypothetical protein
VEAAERAAALGAADLEDARLGGVEELAGAAFAVEHRLHDARRHLHQAALHRLVAHDARVVDDVGGGGLEVGDLGEEHRAADGVQQLPDREVVREGHEIDRLAVVVERHHRLEERLVRRVVEVVGADLFGHVDERAPVEHQRRARSARRRGREADPPRGAAARSLRRHGSRQRSPRRVATRLVYHSSGTTFKRSVIHVAMELHRHRWSPRSDRLGG